MTAIPGGYREGMDKNILTCCRGSRTKARLAEEAPRWLIATVYREEDSLDARVLAGAKEAYEIIRSFLEPESDMNDWSNMLERARNYLNKINEGRNNETP